MMNNSSITLLLLVNIVCINGMDNYKEVANPLNKNSEKITTQPIPIPKATNSPKEPKPSMIHIEISPSSHLWQLGNYGNRSPEKKYLGESLR